MRIPQAGVLPQTAHDESIKDTADRVLNRAVISIQTACADLWTTRLQHLSQAVILWIIHAGHIWWAYPQATVNLFYLQRRGWFVVPALHKNGILTSLIEVTAPFRKWHNNILHQLRQAWFTAAMLGEILCNQSIVSPPTVLLERWLWNQKLNQGDSFWGLTFEVPKHFHCLFYSC